MNHWFDSFISLPNELVLFFFLRLSIPVLSYSVFIYLYSRRSPEVPVIVEYI